MNKLNNAERLNQLDKEIRQVVSKLILGIDLIKSRKDFQNLRLSDQFHNFSMTVKNYAKSENYEYLDDAIAFYQQNQSAAEGENTFNSTVWNTDIVIDGRSINLNELMSSLLELHYEKKKLEAEN